MERNTFKLVFQIYYKEGKVSGIVEIPAFFDPYKGYLTCHVKGATQALIPVTVNVIGESIAVWYDDDLVSIDKYTLQDILKAFDVYVAVRSARLKKDVDRHSLSQICRSDTKVLIQNPKDKNWYEYDQILVQDAEACPVFGNKL